VKLKFETVYLSVRIMQYKITNSVKLLCKFHVQIFASFTKFLWSIFKHKD